MRVFLVAVFVSGVASVMFLGAYGPILWIVIKGVTVLMLDVLTVSLMDLAIFFKMGTGEITILTLLDLDWALLVLSLSLPVGSFSLSSLPTLQRSHCLNFLLKRPHRFNDMMIPNWQKR